MTPIEIPIPPRVLNPNTKAHWAKKYRASDRYRADCLVLARAHAWKEKPVIPGGRIPLHVQWHPKTNHEYDEDNAYASLKYALDAIALAWGVNDSRFTLARFDKMPKVEGGKVLIGIHDERPELLQ